MFCEVVCQGFGPVGPIHIKLLLVNLATDPIEPHVDGSQALLLDCFIGNGLGRAVFYLDWCRQLWVAHLF